MPITRIVHEDKKRTTMKVYGKTINDLRKIEIHSGETNEEIIWRLMEEHIKKPNEEAIAKIVNE